MKESTYGIEGPLFLKKTKCRFWNKTLDFNKIIRHPPKKLSFSSENHTASNHHAIERSQVPSKERLLTTDSENNSYYKCEERICISEKWAKDMWQVTTSKLDAIAYWTPYVIASTKLLYQVCKWLYLCHLITHPNALISFAGVGMSSVIIVEPSGKTKATCTLPLWDEGNILYMMKMMKILMKRRCRSQIPGVIKIFITNGLLCSANP